MEKVCVVIPVHSNTPSPYELISFQQCFKVLGGHPIKILAPYNLDLTAYKNVVPIFDIVFIDSKWQSSLVQYNQMKYNLFFYELFDEYEYLLTYELDVFVFKDELLYWCEKKYDYIGAPWLDGYTNASSGAAFITGGNSGFSLRKIKACRNALTKIAFKKKGIDIIKDFFLSSEKISEKLNPINLLRTIYYNSTLHLNKTFDWNEDFYWSIEVPKYFKTFALAPPMEAMKFSMEVQPRYLFQLNNNELPFGCHAWYRYDIEFWKPFINSFGYNI
jgi:hypothetical protein